MPKRLRLKKLINWTVQGPIVVRLLTHFLAYNAATLFLLMTVWGIRGAMASIADQSTPPEPLTFWQQASPVIICMLVMTPFMVWDLMKLTNKIAGPLYRFEALLKTFVKSGKLAPAVLRDGDLLTDFQKQFNEFTEAVHALYPETKPDASAASGSPALTAPASDVAVPFRKSV